MAFRLFSFCKDVGAERIADYFDSVLHCPFPSNELPAAPLERARRITGVVEALPDDVRRRTIADFQRIQKVCDSPGDEALRQVFDPGDWNRILNRHPSALQRALFCYWRWPDHFLNAEFRLSHKTLRRRAPACATYDCPRSLSAPAAPLSGAATDALVSAAAAAVAGKMVPGSRPLVQACWIHSEILAKPEPAFQVGLSWADGEPSQKVHGAVGVSQELIDLARFVTLTYFPSTQRLQITGYKLSPTARDRLATWFAIHVLGTFDPPVRAIPDLIRLDQCMALERVRLPARSSLERAGFEHIDLVTPDTQKRQPVSLDPTLRIRDGVARQINAEYAQRTLPLCEIKKVRLLLNFDPGDGMCEVRVEITPKGFKCSSLLDAHDRVAADVLAQNGILLRAADVPLIARVAR